MSNHQQQEASPSLSRHSQSLPALLPIYHAIGNNYMQRIQKDLARLVKADAVLALVGEVFGLIPLEPDSCHVNIVITNMQLCKANPGQHSRFQSQGPWRILFT